MKMLVVSGNFALNLLGAFYVDIEQQIAAVFFGFLQKAARRSVIVAEHFGVLEESVIANHLLELGPRNKKILPPIRFAAARSRVV